jgi:hypothetical protein
MNPEFVKPDEFIAFGYGDKTYMINEKYDHLEHYVPIGKYILKLIDDEEGLLGFFLEAEVANTLLTAGMQMIERHTMFESEYEWHLNHEASLLEDKWE